MTPAWKFIPPALRSVRIVSFGLQKTGSTSAGWALAEAGIRVSHNQGSDVFSDTCQATFGTVNEQLSAVGSPCDYVALRKRHPTAAWLITYARNFTQWQDSLRRYHLDSGRLRPGLRFMPCDMFGCEMALTEEMRQSNVSARTLFPLHPATGWISPEQLPLLERLHRTYYQRLFAFLDAELGVGRYAVADVRANVYTGFEHLQGLRVRTPFGTHNAFRSLVNRPHHSWYGKTTCCIDRDPFGNPCPEELMADIRNWDWCARTQRYVNRSAEHRERRLAACAQEKAVDNRCDSATVGVIRQQSLSPCTANTSFGCKEDGIGIWVSRGCRGRFALGRNRFMDCGYAGMPRQGLSCTCCAHRNGRSQCSGQACAPDFT